MKAYEKYPDFPLMKRNCQWCNKDIHFMERSSKIFCDHICYAKFHVIRRRLRCIGVPTKTAYETAKELAKKINNWEEVKKDDKN